MPFIAAISGRICWRSQAWSSKRNAFPAAPSVSIFVSSSRILSGETCVMPFACLRIARNVSASISKPNRAANQNHAKLPADGNALWKERHHLIGRGVGRDVVVGRLAAEEQVANAASGEQCLEARANELIANRIGECARRHKPIMHRRPGEC